MWRRGRATRGQAKERTLGERGPSPSVSLSRMSRSGPSHPLHDVDFLPCARGERDHPWAAQILLRNSSVFHEPVAVHGRVALGRRARSSSSQRPVAARPSPGHVGYKAKPAMCLQCGGRVGHVVAEQLHCTGVGQKAEQQADRRRLARAIGRGSQAPRPPARSGPGSLTVANVP